MLPFLVFMYQLILIKLLPIFLNTFMNQKYQSYEIAPQKNLNKLNSHVIIYKTMKSVFLHT